MSYISELAALNKTGNMEQPGSMPNRGTSTGLNGDTYGADISVDATNSLGKMKGATGSNGAMEDCCPGE